jgi:CRISPR-associated protein Csb1
MDYDLRSRCLLVPTGPQRFELLARDGSEPTVVDLSREGAARIVAEAAKALSQHGMAWESEEIRLEPAPKLAELIRRSRQNTAAAGQD